MTTIFPLQHTQAVFFCFLASIHHGTRSCAVTGKHTRTMYRSDKQGGGKLTTDLQSSRALELYTFRATDPQRFLHGFKWVPCVG